MEVVRVLEPSCWVPVVLCACNDVWVGGCRGTRTRSADVVFVGMLAYNGPRRLRVNDFAFAHPGPES